MGSKSTSRTRVRFSVWGKGLRIYERVPKYAMRRHDEPGVSAVKRCLQRLPVGLDAWNRQPGSRVELNRLEADWDERGVWSVTYEAHAWIYEQANRQKDYAPEVYWLRVAANEERQEELPINLGPRTRMLHVSEPYYNRLMTLPEGSAVPYTMTFGYATIARFEKGDRVRFLEVDYSALTRRLTGRSCLASIVSVRLPKKVRAHAMDPATLSVCLIKAEVS